MIRFLLRALGFLLVAASFAALVVDGTRSIAGGRLLFSAFGDTVAWLAGARYDAVTSVLARAPSPVAAAVALLLAAPAWAVTGPLGLLLLAAGRAPAPRSRRS